MSEINFEFEWIDPLGARGAELRATWARLSVIVAGKCITRVFDQESRTVRDAVYVPLYPLAEWLATRWWSLLFEVPSTDRLQDLEYQARHGLRFARDGFAFPAAMIDTLGDVVHVAWSREVLPNHRLEFIEEGTARIPLADFQQSVRAFVGAVVTRLDEQKVTASLLQQEWSANLAADDEERDFCAAAAALGLDPFAIEDAAAASIVGVANTVPASIQREFFDVAASNLLNEQASGLAQTLEKAQANEAELGGIVELREELAKGDGSPSGLVPWERGYAAARRVRELLKLGDGSLQTFEQIAKALHVTNGGLQSALIGEPLGSAPYEALVATNRRHSPSFTVARHQDDAARRFRFCRGLYEFLQDHGDGPWLVTRAQSDRQKRSRAFAAEFLAPAAAIRERVVPGRAIASDDVDGLAAVFGVSSFVIQHQLENHRIAEILES